jgi:transposase
MNCIYCSYPKTYQLANNQRKCAKCRRKFSIVKLERVNLLRKSFQEGKSATATARENKLHIATVLKYFDSFRKELTIKLEIDFNKNSNRVDGYDEYLYIPKSLNAEDNIDKIEHFLTISYDNRVYNIMMPSPKKYYIESPDKGKLLLKYLQFNRVSKISNAHSTIRNFWNYFEKFILQYRGVRSENFIYYLKEAEWRFNKRV